MRLPSGSARSLLIALPIAVVLLYVAFRGVDWREILATVASARLEMMALGFAVYTVSQMLRAVRWRVLLSAQASLPLAPVFWATAAGYLGNQFLPARAGELVRSALLGRRAGLGTTYVLATALTERILDALALVAIGFGALWLTGIASPALLEAARVMAVVALVAVIGLLILPRLETRALALLELLPIRGRLLERLIGLIQRFLLGLQAFQHGGRAVSFALLTGAIWLIDAVAAICVALALDREMSIPQALLLLAALGLSSAVPSTPGYLGIYQFVARAVLPAFGFTDAQSLAYIICLQGLIVAIVVVWGSIGIWRLRAVPASDP